MKRFMPIIIMLLILASCGTPISKYKVSSYHLVTTYENDKIYENLLNELERRLAQVKAREIEDEVQRFREHKDNLEDKLYLLDDMAAIYATGMVNFKKSSECNKEALLTYEKIKKIGLHNIPLSNSSYYNNNRLLYFCVLFENKSVPKEQAVSGQKTYFQFASPFSKSFLDYVREKDLENAKIRIDLRSRFINEKMGMASEKKEGLSITDNRSILMPQDQYRPSSKQTNALNPYYHNYHLAQKQWKRCARDTFQNETNKLLTYIVQSLDAEKSYRAKDDYETLAYLYCWSGIAHIRGGNATKGVLHLEEFIKIIDKHEKSVIDRQERLAQAAESLNDKLAAQALLTAIGGGIINLGLNIVGSVVSLVPLAGTAGRLSSSYFQTLESELIKYGSQSLATTVTKYSTEPVYKSISSKRMDNFLKELLRYQSPYAIKINRFLDRHDQLAFFEVLGDGYKNIGQLQKAIDHYKEAVQIIENQRETIYSEPQRIGFLKERELIYGKVIPLMVEMNHIIEAFEYTERAKSRAFVDLIGGVKLTLKTDAETETYSNIIYSQSEVDVVLNQKNISLSQYTSMIGNINTIQEQGQIKKPSMELLSLSNVKTLSFKEIANLLSNQISLVEYYITDNGIIIFTIDSGNINAVTKRIPKAELVKQIRGFRRSIENVAIERSFILKPIDAINEEPSTIKNAIKLYEILFQPVRNMLSAKELYIVPHGALHYLPFQALHDGKEYLVEKYSMSYLPSATVLKFVSAKKSKKGRGVLVIANPDLNDPQFDLPFAEMEARYIKESFPDSQIFVRKEATKTKLKKMSKNVEVIHFASHGDFDVVDPYGASLFLAGGDKNDGRLAMTEVFSLDLCADLVVLSACKTGLSKISSGDELIGFTRGFFYAGTPSVISSLWAVNDESTAYLMKLFYKNLKIMPKAMALQNAQMDTMVKYPKPYHWAPFILAGLHI